MSRRRERKVETHLPHPEPSPQFLATGPTKNAVARRRIASAGAKLAASGKWPTLALVLTKDTRIRPATLDRNSDALDDARRAWIRAECAKLLDEGEFPTIALLQRHAGSVRAAVLARFEDSLAPARNTWVERNGPHPDWSNEAIEQENAAEPSPDPEPRIPGAGTALSVVGSTLDPLELAQSQIKRLLAERKANRAQIRELKVELLEATEGLRRSMLGIRKKHILEINAPSTSTRT